MPLQVASRRRTTLQRDFPDALLDITSMKGIKRTARRFGPPLGHRLDGRLLGYEEARRTLYLPTYRWMLDNRTPELVAELRELSCHRTVVLLDYTTNGDMTDLSTPLSHAALVVQRIQEP